MGTRTGHSAAAAWITLACLNLGSSAASAQQPGAPALTTEQVLARVAAAYASCRTYSDSGVVIDRYPGIVGHTTEKRFRTAFVRPDRFRFQYVETKGLLGGDFVYIVWRRGDDVRTWWDVRPGVERPPSLGAALSAATGVSGRSSHTVPEMLLRAEVGGRHLTDVSEPRLLDDATVGPTPCHRIGGMHGDEPITLWVEKGSYLVRRIDLRTRIPEGAVESTTTYEPVLDGELTEAMLAFDPPVRK